MTKRFLLRFTLLLLILGMAGVAHAFFGLFETGPRMVQPDNGVVRLSLDQFRDGAARRYALNLDGKNVPFFVVQSRDGVTRAAFDACDVCYAERKGYSQDGEHMVCNNCGQRFHIARINEVKGGCNPAPLHRTVEGGDLVIRAADIAAGAGYF